MDTIAPATSSLSTKRSRSFSSAPLRNKEDGERGWIASLHHRLLNRGHSNPTVSIVMLLNRPACQKVPMLFSFFLSSPPFRLAQTSRFVSLFPIESLIEDRLSTLYTRPLFFAAFSLSLVSLVVRYIHLQPNIRLARTQRPRGFRFLEIQVLFYQALSSFVLTKVKRLMLCTCCFVIGDISLLQSVIRFIEDSERYSKDWVVSYI